MALEEDEIELVDYFRVILSRKWFILIGVLLSTGLVYIYTLTLPNIYTATAKILVLKKPKFQLKSETKLITEDAEVGVNTHMNLLFSQEIARRVLAVLSSKSLEKIKNLTPQDILESGKANLISGTDIIELIVKNRDPELAKEICFHWATAAIKYNDEIYSSENRDINNVVIKQYSDVKSGMADAEAKIISFVTKNLRISEEIIEAKRKALIQNTDKIDLIHGEVEKFENELPLIFNIAGNNTVVSIERQIALSSNDLAQKKINIDRLKNRLKELDNHGNNRNNTSMFTLNSRESDNSIALEPEISITTNKDPMIFKTELSISSLETKIADLELFISKLKKGFPELNKLFSKITKVKWLRLNRDEIISTATNFKLDLNSYIDFPGINEIDNTLNNILNYAQKKAFLEQLKTNNENINRELKEYTINNENFDLAINKLKADYSFLKSSYETLGKKLEENRVQSRITPANIKMVEPPYTPTSPSSPNVKKIITITIFASAFLFIFLTFLLNALKNERIRK